MRKRETVPGDVGSAQLGAEHKPWHGHQRERGCYHPCFVKRTGTVWRRI
jgi:hypothetical protein